MKNASISRMISTPGMSVPAMAPELLRKADSFIPRKLRNVASHRLAITTMNTNQRLFASAGLNTYAIAEATKVSTAGNHGRFSTHCIEIATKPHFGPNASFTHR